MQPEEPYIIDEKEYSRIELLRFGETVITDARQPEWKKELYRFIMDFLVPGTPIIQETSGTTGDPTVFELDRQAMLNSAQMTLEHFGIRKGDCALLCLPVKYIAGKMMVVRALAGGLDLMTTEPSGNPFRKASSQGPFYHLAAMVPLQLYEAIRDPEMIEACVGTLLIGGGEIAPGLRKKIARLREVSVFETFGMTETLSHFAVKRINGPDPDPCFRTLEGVKTGTDERGCLSVSVEGITNEKIITNDIVQIIDDHSFNWLGRYDNVIKTGGIKVIPEQVEAKIRQLTGIENELVIAGSADDKLGQKVILFIEGKENEISISGLMATFRTYLEKHEIPKEIRFLTSFPRNSSMKVERRKLT